MTNPDVLMPVALDSAGDLLWVTAAANGIGAAAVCICCCAPVVAKQGDDRAWHFAHHNPVRPDSIHAAAPTGHMPIHSCNGEGWLHLTGKRLLRSSLERALGTRVPLPLRFDNDCFHQSHDIPTVLPTTATHVAEEEPLEGVRPDLALWAGNRVLMFFEVIVTHAPAPSVYAHGVPVVEFRLHAQGDLWKVDSERSPTLYSSRVVNQSPGKRCRDKRKPCRACGRAIKPKYVLCYNCASHDCEQCQRPTTRPGRYCSAGCEAEAKGMSICECGKWHSADYDSCYECGGPSYYFSYEDFRP